MKDGREDDMTGGHGRKAQEERAFACTLLHPQMNICGDGDGDGDAA